MCKLIVAKVLEKKQIHTTFESYLTHQGGFPSSSSAWSGYFFLSPSIHDLNFSLPSPKFPICWSLPIFFYVLSPARSHDAN